MEVRYTPDQKGFKNLSTEELRKTFLIENLFQVNEIPMVYTNIEKGQLDQESYFNVAKKLKETFEFKTVAITLRESYSASRNGWSAILLDDKECKEPYLSTKYDIEIVDRVGGGDSFASGLIYGLIEKQNTTEALEFAVAASCLKHTIPGDFNLVSIDEVEKLIKSGGSGRVER